MYKRLMQLQKTSLFMKSFFMFIKTQLCEAALLLPQVQCSELQSDNPWKNNLLHVLLLQSDSS